MRTNKLFKWLFFGGDVLLAAVAAMLIIVNIYAANFSAGVVVAFSVLAAVGCGAYLIIFKTALVTKIIFPVAISLVALFCSFFAYSVPYWDSYTFKSYGGASLTYDGEVEFNAAKSDLALFMGYLKRTHPAYTEGEKTAAALEEVDARYDEMLESFRTEHGITANKIRRAIQYIINPLSDAHTYAYDNFAEEKYLSEEPKLKFEGYTLLSVNGKTVEEIYKDAKPYYSHETESGIDVDFTKRSTLDFLGLTSPFRYVWGNEEGGRKIANYIETDFVPYKDYFKEYRKYFGLPVSGTPFASYTVDDKNDLITLTLTSCIYNDLYKNTLKEMFTVAKTYGIGNVAVDLRGNGGGNSLVANEFIRYLPVDSYQDLKCDWRWNFVSFGAGSTVKNGKISNLTFEGNVYVLTDAKTFSSAKDFAMLIQDNDLGEVVGEQSANSANSYGDVALFVLPNSGLYVQISTKKWHRVDPDNESDFIIPDHPCDGNAAFDELLTIINN